MQQDERSSKERILKLVRKGLLQKDVTFPANLDWESDVFARGELNGAELFAESFTFNKGQFVFCYNQYHFIDQFLSAAEQRGWESVSCIEKHLMHLFNECDFPLLSDANDVLLADAGITGCDALIARTGSIILSSLGNKSRTISVFPPVHIVVAYRNQVVYDLKQYLNTFSSPDASLPSMMSIVSGPSRTSDIEKTLVMGAHGPKEMFVFYVDEDKPE